MSTDAHEDGVTSGSVRKRERHAESLRHSRHSRCCYHDACVYEQFLQWAWAAIDTLDLDSSPSVGKNGSIWIIRETGMLLISPSFIVFERD